MTTPQKMLAPAPAAPVINRNLTTAAAAREADSLAALTGDVLDRLIRTASDAVSAYCNVASVAGAPATFARQSVAETTIYLTTSHAPIRRKLFMSLRPASVVSITISGVAVDLADLFLEMSAISFLPGASRTFWPVDEAIVATYDAGFVTPPQQAEAAPPSGPDLPSDIERATIITAQHLYAQQSRQQFDVAATVEEDSDAGRMETRYFNAGRSPGVPAAAQALLQEYVRLF